MKIPVHNNTAMTIFVAGVMIPAGETKHFEEHQVPQHLRPAPVEQEAPAEPDDPLAKLLEESIAKITAQFDTLSTEQIEKLGELEQLGQARKGLLSAVAEELLNRAAASDLKTRLDAIPGMTDEALAESLTAEEGKGDEANADYLAALKAEAAKREGSKE